MKIYIRDVKEADCVCDALILPLIEEEGIGPYFDVDSATNGLLKKIITSKEFQAKHNQVSLIHTFNKIKPERVLLIGLGKKKEISKEKLRLAGGRAAVYLRDLGMKEIALSTRTISSLNLSPSDFVEGSLLSIYRFDRYRKEEEQKDIKGFAILSKDNSELNASLKWTETVASATHFVRDLINTPSNDMTPTALSDAARSISGGKVSVKVLERRDIERLGMGAYLSVAKGSMEPPKFIVIEYDGGKGAPIALIGKSITFDSGGISLKPSEGMEKMKYDMAGGAVVIGVIKAASVGRLPVNLVGILPATENLPGGTASKPGDIVKTITGKAVEIISTDAEGRLALVDAIGYALKYHKPKALIDIATLTGACSVALGNEAIAMMGNDETLMNKIKAAGEETYERVWQMPLYDEYKEYIKSDVADLKNTGGKSGSLVTAAYFLKEFAEETPWVHLDIAGTAWAEKDKPYTPKGASGIGVRLLLNFIKELR